MTPSNGKINGTPAIKRSKWRVYKRTGGGFIATCDPPQAVRNYVWITELGVGWMKEVGQPPVLLGNFDSIGDVIKKALKS